MTEVKQVNTQAMIQIKRNNKVFFTLEDFGEGSKLSYQLMDHHYIILKFTTATPIYFEIGDSVEIPDFGYFELTSSYFPKHNDSDGYDYEMQMDAYYMSWKNKLCKYRPQHGANETSFKLTTTVGVHMNVILGNLKALGLTYNGKEFSVDYTTYNNKAFDVQKRFLIEYGSISILDALNAICSEDALNCEWWIDGSIIYLGYCEMEGQTTFEQDVNVLSMSYSESKSTYITRLYAFGSDRNIPKGYFTGADADVTTDGVATDYLMLPNKEVDSDGFYAKDGYLENVNVVKNDKQAIEGVVMFEDEYPKVECRVSRIKTYDSTVDNDDGTKTTQTFWQIGSTDSFAESFEASWIKSNLTLGIKFTSGALMGMEFDVSFKIIDKENFFEIVANDTYGRILPDSVMCPKEGDRFFLFNWDATKITDTDLIPTAQLSLFDRAKQYYQKTMISNSNFTCTMDGDKFYNDGIYDYHPLGEQVKLINDMFAQVDADGKHYRNSRIIGMEIPLDIPYDHPQYIVGEKAATSRLGKLEDKVDSIKVNGMQIGGTGSGNGGGVYVIGMNDTTPASDSNVYSARRSRMEFVSRLQDNTAKSTITWEKVQKFLGGLLVGNSNNENGGSWIPDAEGRSHLITDYLEVRMKAIFEELVIKETSTIGGKEIISPAGGVVAHKVEEVTVTYNNVSQKAYRCYFLAEQDGDEVDNDFAVNDQVRSESFNVRKGTYHKAGNHFYWRLVIGRDEDPVELEGKKYHYIDLSDTDCATASDVPAKGDVLNQCGNRTDVERQNCLIFSAVDTYSPSISLYHGINSYSFANREYVEYGVNKQTNKAFFNVYGDMYVGDRPTKENGYEGSSYIRYDSSTKQLSVKGKISAKSTVDGKELSQYIKENTDDTVANAAKKAAEDAQKAAQTAQTDIKNLGKTVTDNKKEFDNYVTDGYLEPSEIAAMAQDSKRLEDDFAAAQKSYNEVKEAEVLTNTKELTDLNTAFATLTTAKTELVTYLSDISTNYNKADTTGKATIVSAVGTKFTNFQSAYSAFYDKLGLANAYITSKIYGDLKQNITDLAGYKYLKDALGQTTYVDGGLVMTTLLALRDGDGNVQSGINGAIDKNRGKKSIATWWGGQMVDKDYNSGNLTPATSLIRFDGSGYLANGAIWWDVSGKVHADPTSFIISEKNLGAYLTFFEPTWKEGSAGTSVADLVSLKPNAPFSKLGVSGDATFEGAISFHGIKLTYDSKNKAIKIDGNLYTTGGITAYGAGASTTGGGGLNGSVKKYSDALKLTSESLSEIASAYSIKALDSRISSLEGGSATSIETTGSGNAVTSVSKSGTKITFTKGSTFSLNGHTHTFASLTSKPTSLSGYGITDGVNAVSVTGSGNAVTAASVSGHTLTLTKGSSFSLSNHTHYVGTTQVQGSSAEQALTGITKIDNILKLSKASVTVNTSYKAEQNRLVIYGTTYGNDANYIKSAGKLSYGDGGPQLVFSTSDNPDASGVQSAALVYTDHDTIGVGVSLSFVTNQGDAYFIAPHIKALTAFQGNLAWSYITNKPTTLSGFGITDGLRSVTQPSGSNVFVTGISTSGTAITYTKSYTKKSLSAVGTSGWTNASIDGNIIPDMSFIAYWNGAYSGTSSNLAYCNKGAFGSFAIKNSLAFSELTSKPTTISGYGITDAYTKSQVDTIAAKYLPLTGGTLTGQLKIEASALNGAYNGLRIGDDCYIGDCNFGNTIGLMGVGNNNAGMVKFGKGGMQFGYNGSNHIASTTAQWTNLNADLLDGWHKDNIVWSGAVNSNTANLSHYWAKLFDITVTDNQYDDRSFTFLFSNGFRDTYSVVVLGIRQNGAKGSGAYNFGISLRELVGNMSSRLRVYYNNATGNVQLWGNCQGQYGSLSYTIIKKTGRTSADFTSQGTLVTNTSFSAAQSLPATTGDSPYTLLDGATRIGIVNQADQLVTARTIWGQSFNGTANVSGALSGATTISASNTISTTLQNGALKIGNKLTPISAIDAQVIFNTGAAIRFGETNWDWNQWAGLKYTHSNKTIYLGIADGSVFEANSAQRNGTLKFPGITTITPDSGVRIGGSGGDLYLGNANNTNWVKVQDICSQAGSTYWQISQSGNASFKSLNVNNAISCGSISVSKNAVIAGNLSVNGLINNKGILPANYEFNNKGASCYVSADALCSGITAITDSIQVNQVTVQYSNDSGNSWTNYSMSNDAKFNLYASNAGLTQVYLGYNVITGNNDAEKLAQVKKNELIVSFYISNSCYAQPCFASVDISNGIDTICTVDILNNSGAIVETYTKHMTGWNQINYISLLPNGNAGYGVGNNDRRYISFRFKHDQKTTALRNTVINKIRIFSFTKYSFPTDRFMGHTGHIYNFDYNMNTYFPNSILAKGGVTAYQSSDIRLKQDLRKLDYLGIIKAMGGTYGFAWKKDNTRSIGWIAQHVLCNPQLKDIVETDENGYYKINYWSPKLIATAFGAIEQVGDEVSRLKARVVFLESEVLRLSGDKEDCNKKRLDNKNINSLN